MIATNKTFFRTYLTIGIALCAFAIYQTQLQTQALLKVRTRYKWVVVMGFFALYLIVAASLLLRRDPGGAFWERVDLGLQRGWRKWLGLLVLLAGIPLLWYVKFDFFGKALPVLFPFMAVLWCILLAQSVGFKASSGLPWAAAFALPLLLDGLLIETYNVLQPVTDYPFSLGWSEASRYYYGSLWFSRSLYGRQFPLSIWHGTRYLLQSIPFLIQGLPLWADRLWQALLWLGLTGLTAWLFVRRLGLRELTTKFILGGWCFLFLFQGAVYYHLLVSVIIILLGVSAGQDGRSLIAILLASFWAGMSRLNWYVVPALLAIMLYLLEKPVAKQKLWQYLSVPALWAILGLIAALLGQTFYIFISGNSDLRAFGSSLTSPLLWYRWFPSDTNPLGIIPGILLVSLPLLIILYLAFQEQRTELHFLRWLGIGGILIVLLAGGLVVSTKIGGGGDLHNMDAYMVALALAGCYFLAGRAPTELPGVSTYAPADWPVVAGLLLIPLGFAMSRLVPPIQFDRAQAARDVAQLQAGVQSYSRSGPVLFLYERQLLTFGMVRDVPMVPDYEVVTVMEMALSDNEPYLHRFYQDLHDHRFAAIVARRQNLDSGSADFPEESAVWNQRIAYPLLCEYEPVITVESGNVQVFVPRAVRECPLTSSVQGRP